MANWSIRLDDLPQGGFAPQYWREDYPRYGNSNMAGEMTSMDLTRAGYIQPGPATVLYPGGASVVTNGVLSIVKDSSSALKAYAGGRDSIYTLGTGVSASLTHSLSATSGTAYIHSMKEYKTNFYYSWLDNGGTAVANIGKYDGSSTFDDTWWTGSLSATAFQSLGNIELPIEIGNNDVMYIANGRYMASYDETLGVAQDKALDLPEDSVIQDVRWMNDRLFIPARHSQYGYVGSSVYVWDGTTNSWDTEIPVAGQVGAGYASNGTYYQFYWSNDGDSTLAMISNNRIVDLVTYSDNFDIPKYYQVTEWRGYLVWINGLSTTDVLAWGPLDGSEPQKLFHLNSIDANAIGTITNTNLSNGLLISYNSELYYLDTFPTHSNYETTNSTWKSTLFDISGDRINAGQVNAIRFNFEALESDAVLDWSLVNNQGKTIYSDTISYAKATAANPLHTLTTAFYPLNGLVTENFRIELNYANGSTTKPVRIMNMKCYGEG